MRHEPVGLQKEYEDVFWTHNEMQMATGWKGVPLLNIHSVVQWPRSAVIQAIGTFAGRSSEG